MPINLPDKSALYKDKSLWIYEPRFPYFHCSVKEWTRGIFISECENCRGMFIFQWIIASFKIKHDRSPWAPEHDQIVPSWRGSLCTRANPPSLASYAFSFTTPFVPVTRHGTRTEFVLCTLFFVSFSVRSNKRQRRYSFFFFFLFFLAHSN